MAGTAMDEEERRRVAGILSNLGLVPISDEDEQDVVSTLYRPVQDRDWILLFRLIQEKKGPMDGDVVDVYLKEYFGVGDLRLVSEKSIRELILFLEKLPSKV